MNLKNKLLAVIAAGSVLLGSAPAKASWTNYIPLVPGQQRHTYKISSITNADIFHYCVLKKNFVADTYRRYNKAVCVINGSSNVAVGGGDIFRADNNYLHYLDLNDLCRWKHPRTGAFVGDGGYSCYDSYRQF